jgi:hypothetical protein
MMRISLLFALSACARPTPPIPATEQADAIGTESCGADCTSSLSCKDVTSRCRFCSPWGTCSATLPADPKDAGIDAGDGTTP